MAKMPEGWKVYDGKESFTEARSVLTFFKGLQNDWITPWSVIVRYYEPLTEYEKGLIKNKNIEELQEILEKYVRNWDPQNGPQIEGEPQPVYVDEVAAVLTEKLREAGY